MKIFNENSFLNEYGEDTFKMFLDKEVRILLNSAESMGELEVIQGLIIKRIKDIALEIKNKK